MDKNGEVSIIIRAFLVMLGIFGLVPLLSFSKYKLLRKSIHLIYTIILITFVLIVKEYFLRNLEARKTTFSEYLESVVAQLAWFVAIIQSYKSRFIWCKLINEALLSSHVSSYKWLIKCPILYALIFGIVIFMAYANSVADLVCGTELNVEISTCMRNLLYLRVVFLANYFKDRYTCLNRQLQKLAEEPSDTAMKIILSIRKSYLELDDLVQEFNDLNGYQILLVVAFSSLQLMNFTIFSISYFRYDTFEIDTTFFLFMLLLPYLLSIVSLIHMMNSCNAVAQASEELLRTSYEMNRHFSIFSEQFLELKSLSKLMCSIRTKISAADYFEINRLTIFYFLYNTSTYFVVLMQFYSAKNIPVNSLLSQNISTQN